MPPKTIRKCLADTLEDLSSENFKKFCRQLIDRKDEPKVRRKQIEDKDFLDIADVLVNTFTDSVAVKVAVELLQDIGCNSDAQDFLAVVKGLSSNSGASVTAGPSDVASGGNTMTDDKHFVDKWQVELKSRVTNLGPILDELLQQELIHQEAYNTIRARPTNEEKMRELYSGCLRGGTRCKDIFYQILERYEKYLIEDLKNKK